MREDGQPLVYSVDEARKLLGISRGLVYQAIHAGQIPSIRVGRRVLIPRAALQRFLDEVGKSPAKDYEDLS